MRVFTKLIHQRHAGVHGGNNIDHFSIATTHRDRPIDLVTKLGFTTADCYTDRTVHFIFENSYFELCTYQLNTTITWLTQSVPATNLPKVHSSPERQGD